MEDFSTGGYDAVFMIYNEFKSAIAQEVVCEHLLAGRFDKSAARTKEHGDFFQRYDF